MRSSIAQTSLPLPAAHAHVKSLDGLRALAVFAVMGHHFGFFASGAGWLGVDFFFALSGFLITTLLCREYATHGRIALNQFWMRRFCRLMPAYWLYILLVTAAILATPFYGLTPHDGWSPSWLIASLWGYFVNLAPAGLWSRQILTFHLWSLAMEEQFYLVWPVVCLLALGSRWPWRFPLVAFGFLCLLPFLPADHPTAARLSYVRGVGILAGCAVALYLHDVQGRTLLRLVARPAVRNTLFCMMVASVAGLEWYTRKAGVAGESVVRARAQMWFVPPFVMLCSLFIAGSWYGTANALTRLLGLPPLAYLGRISYGMYLYHMVCLLAVRSAVEYAQLHFGVHIRFYIAAPFFIASVVGIASLSYWIVEKPFLNMKNRFRPRPGYATGVVVGRQVST